MTIARRSLLALGALSFASDAEAQWVRTGVLQALAARYRVIAMDARGHGRSGKPDDPARYGPEMGLDVVRLLDHLGIRRAHLVGYSMGAHIVAQLLVTHPERFLTATLGGASGRRNWSAEDQWRGGGGGGGEGGGGGPPPHPPPP